VSRAFYFYDFTATYLTWRVSFKLILIILENNSFFKIVSTIFSEGSESEEEWQKVIIQNSVIWYYIKANYLLS